MKQKGKPKVYLQIFYVTAKSFDEAINKKGDIISCTEVSENPQITELVSAIGAQYNKEPWNENEDDTPEMGFSTKHRARLGGITPRKHDVRKVS